MLPLLTRIAQSLGNWLSPAFGENLKLAPDLDQVPALSIEREALWARIAAAAFLSDDEKREAVGYGASATLARALKYSPDQPRKPGGQPGGGQWTSGGGNDGRVLSDENPDELVPGAEYAQNLAIVKRSAVTGNPKIDSTTIELTKTLAEAMDKVDLIRGLSAQEYGRLVHAEFARLVRQGNMPGISFSDVERTFSLDPDARYGSKGSIRTDAVLRDDTGRIIAIYDVKTRDAVVSTSRADELRMKTQSGPDVPVIELNIVRGNNIKGLDLGRCVHIRASWSS